MLDRQHLRRLRGKTCLPTQSQEWLSACQQGKRKMRKSKRADLRRPGVPPLKWWSLPLPAHVPRGSPAPPCTPTVKPGQHHCSQTCSSLSLRRTTSPLPPSAVISTPSAPACEPCFGNRCNLFCALDVLRRPRTRQLALDCHHPRPGVHQGETQLRAQAPTRQLATCRF